MRTPTRQGCRHTRGESQLLIFKLAKFFGAPPGNSVGGMRQPQRSEGPDDWTTLEAQAAILVPDPPRAASPPPEAQPAEPEPEEEEEEEAEFDLFD